MNRDLKRIIRFAAFGLAITVIFVIYQLLTDSSPPPPPNMPLLSIFIILCPASLLSVPFIDMEIGTQAFYVIWSIVAVANTLLYAFVGLIVSALKALKTTSTDSDGQSPL